MVEEGEYNTPSFLFKEMLDEKPNTRGNTLFMDSTLLIGPNINWFLQPWSKTRDRYNPPSGTSLPN